MNEIATETSAPSISSRLADFAAGVRLEDVPRQARDYAKALILDGIGIALASAPQDFAKVTHTALSRFGGGKSVVIGFPGRLPLRDAALLNGVLIHGIDYDDTHLRSVVHPTSSCLPTALLAADLDRSGADLLLAYILGVEISARIGAVAKGELNQIGFHPTGLVAAFGAAVAAGRLYGLDAAGLMRSQGIVLSMASGTREYSSEGTWTKRLHPGWASVCGINSAALADTGFLAPSRPYEGPFGLYATHLGDRAKDLDLSLATADLGSKWEVLDVAVKPYPCGQFGISCIDAALALRRAHHLHPSDIAAVEVAVPPHAVKIMLEPLGRRRHPHSSYAAQFSIPFLVASVLTYGRLSLAELELFDDPALGALADRVGYVADPDTDYPRHFPCRMTITLKSGERLEHDERINRGSPDRPVTIAEIETKFHENAAASVLRAQADAIHAAVMGLDTLPQARDLADLLQHESD
jgi:2-methylcitrate dehydratase PrpD